MDDFSIKEQIDSILLKIKEQEEEKEKISNKQKALSSELNKIYEDINNIEKKIKNNTDNISIKNEEMKDQKNRYDPSDTNDLGRYKVIEGKYGHFKIGYTSIQYQRYKVDKDGKYAGPSYECLTREEAVHKEILMLYKSMRK